MMTVPTIFTLVELAHGLDPHASVRELKRGGVGLSMLGSYDSYRSLAEAFDALAEIADDLERESRRVRIACEQARKTLEKNK